MLEVIAALAAAEAHSESTHFRAESSPRDAQGTPTQSAAQASISQSTADFQGTAEAQGTADIPQSPNDYTPTDESQTSGGDEGLLDLYALNREVRRLKKQTISQAKQIHKLKAKLKKLSKGVQPVVEHHALWVKSQNLKKQKKRRKKQKKKVSSVKLGRNKDESNLSEEHHDQDDHHHTAFVYEDVDAQRCCPSSPIRPTQEEESKEQFKDDEFLADLNRTRGLSIPGPMQSQPQQPTQATDLKEKGKGILVEEPKKKKLTLQQIRALETAHDEEERKRYPQMKELYDKVQESIKDSFKDFTPMDSEKEKQMLQERDAKRLLRKRKATATEEQPSKKLKLREEDNDEIEKLS
ncbi:hypothetical protein Tco_0117300 [Tanacetum coccineum]